PAGEARVLTIDPVEQRLSLSLPNRPPVAIDLRSGDRMQQGPGALALLFAQSRGLHEHLLFGLSPLVPISTAAMLVLAALGVLMGWPRLRNTLSGWHKGVAWGLLPLIILSPLTGLALTFNITFASPTPAGPAAPIREAARLVAGVTDPSNILFIAQRGGRQMARVMENGALRTYAVSRQGLSPMPNNWPRLIHEGNWNGFVAGGLNAITALAMLGLLGTGLLIWARRRFRRPARLNPASVTADRAGVVQ
ncbi:MAG: hypothetical protein JWN07_1581, partial [Hyphomicrobiales bacterium]|nr:hypothetical protein [Hyphomicrobiales bacterium]